MSYVILSTLSISKIKVFFLEKHVKQNIPYESTLRRYYMDSRYENLISLCQTANYEQILEFQIFN